MLALPSFKNERVTRHFSTTNGLPPPPAGWEEWNSQTKWSLLSQSHTFFTFDLPPIHLKTVNVFHPQLDEKSGTLKRVKKVKTPPIVPTSLLIAQSFYNSNPFPLSLIDHFLIKFALYFQFFIHQVTPPTPTSSSSYSSQILRKISPMSTGFWSVFNPQNTGRNPITSCP